MTETDRRVDPRALRVRAVAELPLIATQAAELDDLAARTGAPASVYWPALSAWFRARPEVEPLTVAVFDRNRLVGSAMLSRQKVRGVWRVTGAGTSGEPFSMPAESPEVATRLADGIRAELDSQPGRWKLELTDLPAGDPVADALADLLPDPQRQIDVDAPQLEFDGRSPVNHYLSRNVRSAVAKARNRVTADGRSLELHWLRTPEQIAPRIEQIVDIRHRRNRQLDRGPGYDATELATFTATIANQADAGRARLLEVRIDDELAAYAMCFISAGSTLWVYSNNVSPDFTRYSAGTIANAEVVRYAHGEPDISTLSWGRGVQRYKLSGPVTLARCQSLTAWSSPSTRRMLNLGRTVRRLNPLG